jgi:hypothetical protein
MIPYPDRIAKYLAVVATQMAGLTVYPGERGIRIKVLPLSNIIAINSGCHEADLTLYDALKINLGVRP